MLVEIANQTKAKINQKLIAQVVKQVLKFAKIDGTVSVVIVGDKLMKQLNQQYRGKNKTTDVLSFAEAESLSPDRSFIGELVIAWPQIKRQAKKLKHAVTFELVFIIIHGALHLVGYDDETAAGAALMDKITNRLIKKIAL